MAKDPKFLEAKRVTEANLEAIRMNLNRCVDEGMIDSDDSYYNELLGLLEEAALVGEWEELSEVVAQGKTLEREVIAWLSLHGRATLSLPWPSR